MRVLIVGGTRFIGAHAARLFHERGAQVSVLHRGRTQNPVLPPVAHIRDPLAEYPITRVPAAVAAANWDVVLDMVLMGEADARAAVSAFASTKRFVMISSCDVYRAYGRLTRTEPGPPEPLPLGEEAPLRTVLHPYRGQEATLGAFAQDYEKILAERVVAEAAPPWTILRLPKVYGPEDNADLATIHGFAARPHWRWTHGHVANVAAAIVLAATHPAAGRVYNVGEAHTPTMGERLARLPERGPAPEPPPFDYAQSLVTDTGRIRAELGYADGFDEGEAMADLARSGGRPPGHEA